MVGSEGIKLVCNGENGRRTETQSGISIRRIVCMILHEKNFNHMKWPIERPVGTVHGFAQQYAPPRCSQSSYVPPSIDIRVWEYKQSGLVVM